MQSATILTDRQTDITVIIPVYNCEGYLEAAVDSVLNQPYPHISIVLVDDGSTDGSGALCDRLAGENNDRIHVIHQENAGVSAARNAGITYTLAHNQDGYIAFLDADDVWATDFFTPDIVELLGKGYSLLGFQFCLCNETLTARATAVQLSTGLHPGGISNLWVHNAPFSAMLYSTKMIFKYHILFPSLVFAEDALFHMQYAYLADTIWIEHKLLYYYRMRSSSATHTRPFGIPYYAPIIEAWIDSDKAMLPYANEHRGTMREGRVLARIFTLDMIDEHFMMLRKKSELLEFLHSHPAYIDYLKADLGGQKNQMRYEQMKAHPHRYIATQYAKGVVLQLARMAQKIPLIRKVRDSVRFSIPM